MALVTIIMATFNRAHLILETLESISNQSFFDWECLIIDDGSADETLKVVGSCIKNDPRFTYMLRKSNYKKGLPGCRNQGLDIATGEYVIFFDDDDIVHPENLKTCLEIIQQNNSAFCRYDKKPFTGFWKPGFTQKEVGYTVEDVDITKLGDVVTGKLGFASCCVMWDRKVFENERFNENLQYAEEWELYIRILSSGLQGCSINKVLYYNRKHDLSNTGEFWNKDPIRRASKIEAVKMVINNLKQKDLLTPTLIKYFFQTGFFLNDFSIINAILKASEAGVFKTIIYKGGFHAYFIIRPIFKLKGEFKKKIYGLPN